MFPNPDFPTVNYPNPEEGEGALRLAFATADANNANMVFANDPDSDRFAAAERKPDKTWHIFTGNQLGVLFADCLWQQHVKRKGSGDVAMLSSTVSTQMLKAMAKKEGFYHEVC